VEALNERDGARVCSLLPPGAIEMLDLPRERGGCGPSLSASIGYADPRGFPVFEEARFEDVVSVETEGDSARLTATIVTHFADRKQPSIEDDVVYLERDDRGWVVAQPSATFYRAIGVADVPPQVLKPP
jgi:hypothetical protein